MLVEWGGSDGEEGNQGEVVEGEEGEGEVEEEEEGLSGSGRPGQLPQGSNYEQTMSEHSLNHLPLPLSPAINFINSATPYYCKVLSCGHYAAKSHT